MGFWFLFRALKHLLVSAWNEWEFRPGKLNLLGLGVVTVGATAYQFQALWLAEFLDLVQIDTPYLRTVSDKEPTLDPSLERLLTILSLGGLWILCIMVSTWAEKYLRK